MYIHVCACIPTYCMCACIIMCLQYSLVQLSAILRIQISLLLIHITLLHIPIHSLCVLFSPLISPLVCDIFLPLVNMLYSLNCAVY